MPKEEPTLSGTVDSDLTAEPASTEPGNTEAGSTEPASSEPGSTGTEPDRPWQLPAAGRPATEQVVDEWTRDLHTRLPRTADGAEPGPEREPADGPGISLVVTYQVGDNLVRCLESVAEQTLDRDRFEVIVAAQAEVADLESATNVLTERAPDVELRVVELGGAGVFCVRDIGVAAACRQSIAFLHGDDRISPRYLETLLGEAADDAVILAQVETAGPDDTPATSPIKAGPDKGTPVDPSALATVRGLLVPARLAKLVERDPTPRTHHDVLFVTALLTGHGCAVRRAVGDGAVYLRTVRPAGGEPDAHVAEEPDANAVVTQLLDLIAQLDSLARRGDAGARRLVYRQIDMQLNQVNNHLHANPRGQDKVVEVLDTYDLDYLPYERLNAGLARTLVVAYCFAPFDDSSAIMAAKRIRERREIVDVVCNSMDTSREQDPGLLRICGPYVENQVVVDTPTYFSNWTAVESFCERGLAEIAARERVKGPYERVYSRVMWPASHFLAAAYKLRNPSVSWTAEFSGPVSRDAAGDERSAPVMPGPFRDLLTSGLEAQGIPVPASNNFLQWCEYLAYACADTIVFSHEGQRDHMLGYAAVGEIGDRAREKAVISPHPTLPPAFYSMVGHPYTVPPGVANIACFGRVDATGGLDEVMTALQSLDQVTRDQVRLHVFTPDAGVLHAHVDELGIASHVRVNPAVRFLAFLDLATAFDCLLVKDALTSAGDGPANVHLPPRWSDYAGAGRPVWGLVQPGSPLSAKPLTFTSPVGDVSAARNVLTELAAKAAVGG